MCGVTVTGDGVSLIFPAHDPPLGINQTVNDREFANKHILNELLADSDELRIDLIPGTAAVLQFAFRIPVDYDMIHPPVRGAPERADVGKLFTGEGGSGPVNIWMKVAGDAARRGDAEAVLDALSHIESPPDNHVYQIESVQRWGVLSQLVREFAESWKYGEIDLEEPDDSCDFGTATVYVSAPKICHYTISGEAMKTMVKMCETADVIAFFAEVTEKDASFLIEFYS